MRLEQGRPLTANKGQRQGAIPRASSSNLPVALVAAVVVIGLAALIPLTQSSGVTTTNARLQVLEQQQGDWEARLHEIQVEVATLGGLGRIEEEAQIRLKMTAPAETVYLEIDAPPLEGQAILDRFLPEPQTSEELDDGSVIGKLFGWIPLP